MGNGRAVVMVWRSGARGAWSEEEGGEVGRDGRGENDVEESWWDGEGRGVRRREGGAEMAGWRNRGWHGV